MKASNDKLLFHGLAHKHFDSLRPHSPPPFPTGCTHSIEIGESLTAFALSHHLAYGAVPGGSCSRDTQFVMIKEEKQALLYKETVRQCHFQRFGVRQCPRPLAGGCDTACALCADAK